MYIDIPPKLTLSDMGLNQFGQSPLQFSDSGINQKALSMYDAGVPSNFIQDGDMIIRLNVVDGYIQSTNFVTGVSGWRIDSAGNSEFNTGIYRGSLSVGVNALHIDISGNMWWGNFATYADATYKISSGGVANLSGIVAASVSASNITSGTINASTITISNLVVGTNVGIGTAQDSSGVTYIIGNTVTTGYVNALSITAAAVAAENITGTTITGKQIKTSASGARIVLDTDDHQRFYNGSGAVQGQLYATGTDFDIWAQDDVNILVSGGSLVMAFDYSYAKPYDDAHYTIGKNDGHGLLRVYAYHFSDPSDERLKTNIKPIESALDKVTRLTGVTFDWKRKIENGKRQMGMIAQQVIKVLPEVVDEPEGDEHFYSITYGKIVPLLVEAIKELNNKVDKLTK